MQTNSGPSGLELRASVIQVADIAERSTSPPRFTSDCQRFHANPDHRTETYIVCSHPKLSNGHIVQAQHNNDEIEDGSRKAAD